jgi:hypothetical protein
VKSFLGARSAALTSAAAIGLSLLLTAPASAAGGAPTTPTELFNAYQACSTDSGAPLSVAGRGGLIVEGITGDTDTGVTHLTEQFQLWPVSDPTQIITGSHAYATPGDEASANLGPLSDGQSYAWQARTVDAGGVASDWSAPCYVADDDIAPATAPTLTSANYPSGQQDQGGAPVQFTFDANGASDVAGFEYSWHGDFNVPVVTTGAHGIPTFDPFSQPGFVRANALGGSATVSLIPPDGSGYQRLTVISIDRALNESPLATYSFIVKPDAPTVTQLSHPEQFGKPALFGLTPDPAIEAASPVVSYNVVHSNWQGQTTTTVKANAEGVAELDIPLNGIYGDILSVTSTSANGWLSENASWSNGYVDTSPTVTSDVYTENGSAGGAGVPGTFTFTPKVTGVVSYTYSFGDQAITVKARGQEPTKISWTPTQSGWYDLDVYATTKDGIQLAPYDYYFTVN